MFNKIILYYLLLAITITATLGRNGRLKISRDKIINRINKHEFKLPFCGNISKTRGHQIKNFKAIPLNIINQLNEVTSISELFRKFLPHENKFNVLYHTAINDNQNSSIIIPKRATCTTDYQVVSLRDDDDPGLYYVPPCTRVKRCGGCCNSNLLSCQPTEIEMLNFKVLIMQYNNETFSVKENKIVTVEQHVACKCQCTIKEQDCTLKQVYYVNECCCVCNNFEDQDECYKESDKKIWDSDSCSCQCIEVQECTSGFKFNYNTCSCEPEN